MPPGGCPLPPGAGPTLIFLAPSTERVAPCFAGFEAWAPLAIVSRDFSYPKHNLLGFIHQHRAGAVVTMQAIGHEWLLSPGIEFGM